MKKSFKDKKEVFSLPEQAEHLSSANHFMVPESYFDSLEDQIHSKIELLESLDKTSIKPDFEVPKNYFAKLQGEIQSKITDPGLGKGWSEIMSIFPRPQISLVLASLLVLLFFSLKTREVKTFEVPDSYISQDLLDYSAYLQNLDEFTLVEMLAVQQETNNTIITEDPYVEYLLEHNIELSQIKQSL